MKRLKLFAILSAVVLALAFAGCNGTTDGPDNSGNTGNQGNQDDPPAPVIYQFHDTVTVLPAGTDGTAGTSATYVLFGDWPQTIKAEDVEVDETQTMEMGSFTYYKGNNGSWYAKCTENAYETGYRYSNGTPVAQEGEMKYFEVEPIKWRVLTDNYNGKKLLLAENILINCAYYDYTNGKARTLDDEPTARCNNYKASRLRAYLNGLTYTRRENDTQETDNTLNGKGFLQTAFSTSAQNKIVTTTVDNSESSMNWNGATGENYVTYDFVCGNTEDKIFLLSKQEVTTENYGFANYNTGNLESKRIRMNTDFSKASGANQMWWLRSPYKVPNNTNYACLVNEGWLAGNLVDIEASGVVPALCVAAN